MDLYSASSWTHH